MLAGLSAMAQVRLPELDFPSANGKHEQPIRVRVIRGIVVDENDAVIRNAEVEIRRVDGDKVVEVTKSATDSLGRFRCDSSKGKYQLAIHASVFMKKLFRLRFQGRVGQVLS